MYSIILSNKITEENKEKTIQLVDTVLKFIVNFGQIQLKTDFMWISKQMGLIFLWIFFYGPLMERKSCIKWTRMQKI